MAAKLTLILLMVFSARVGSDLDYVRLYETQDSSSSEYFDCMYYVANFETIPYCQRPDVGTFRSNLTYSSCQNNATMWYYTQLIELDIRPSQVLRWGSSVEVADNYSNTYYNRSEKCDTCFVCECTKLGSFGRFCQYQLTHNAESFEQALDAQFNQKNMNYFGIMQYGSITCYTTLECNYGLLCLEWRDICDGHQQCMYGLDEENCDILEFNECEEDEYRCDNGMCIAEEYWLDGISNSGNTNNPRDDLSKFVLTSSEAKCSRIPSLNYLVGLIILPGFCARIINEYPGCEVHKNSAICLFEITQQTNSKLLAKQ